MHGMILNLVLAAVHVKSCFKVEEETLGLIVYQLGEGGETKWSINIQVGPIVWKRRVMTTCVYVLPNKGSNITHVHVDILFNMPAANINICTQHLLTTPSLGTFTHWPLSSSITTPHSLATPIDLTHWAKPRTLTGSITAPHSLATPRTL